MIDIDGSAVETWVVKNSQRNDNTDCFRVHYTLHEQNKSVSEGFCAAYKGKKVSKSTFHSHLNIKGSFNCHLYVNQFLIAVSVCPELPCYNEILRQNAHL